MAKVSVMTGLTLPIPGQQYGMVKLEIRYTDIDTEDDVESQLKKCDEVALQTAERSEKTLAQTTADTTGLAVEGTGMAKEFANFKEQAQTAIMKIAREVKRQKDIVDALAGQKAGKAKKTPEPEPDDSGGPSDEGQDDPGAQADPKSKREKKATSEKKPLRRRLKGEPEK